MPEHENDSPAPSDDDPLGGIETSSVLYGHEPRAPAAPVAQAPASPRRIVLPVVLVLVLLVALGLVLWALLR